MDTEYMTVRVFIATSPKTLGKVKLGVGMWLVEYLTAGAIPVTRQGFVHGTETTQTELSLKALVNVLTVLKKACSILLYTDCNALFCTIDLGRLAIWEKSQWEKNGEPRPYADLWKMAYGKMEAHIIAVRNGRHDYSLVMENDIKKEQEKWQEASSKNGQTS